MVFPQNLYYFLRNSLGICSICFFFLLEYNCFTMLYWILLYNEANQLLLLLVQSLSRVWLCNPTNCSTPGFPVLHHLLEFSQTPVHWVGGAIESSHPLLPLLLPTIFPSIRVFSNELAVCIRWSKYWSFSSALVLPVNIQGWFPLELTGLISLLSKELSRVFSSTAVQSINSLSAQPSLRSNSHIHAWLREKP